MAPLALTARLVGGTLLAGLLSWSTLHVPAPAALPAGPQDAAAEPAAAPTPAAREAIAALDWLTGRWVIDATAQGQYLEESWLPPAGDGLLGTFRWSRDGKVWLYELMSIEQDGDAPPVFRLRHFSRQLEPWDSEVAGPLTYPMVAHEPGVRVVFENPAADQPRRFVYERSGDQLTVRLEAGDPASQPEAFTFSLVHRDR